MRIAAHRVRHGPARVRLAPLAGVLDGVAGDLEQVLASHPGNRGRRGSASRSPRPCPGRSAPGCTASSSITGSTRVRSPKVCERAAARAAADGARHGSSWPRPGASTTSASGPPAAAGPRSTSPRSGSSGRGPGCRRGALALDHVLIVGHQGVRARSARGSSSVGTSPRPSARPCRARTSATSRRSANERHQADPHLDEHRRQDAGAQRDQRARRSAATKLPRRPCRWGCGPRRSG